LNLSPPGQAPVLCCDEKSHVQALNGRLPIDKGRAQTMIHDYKRNDPRHRTAESYCLRCLKVAVYDTYVPKYFINV
jgi:hypothetical protein